MSRYPTGYNQSPRVSQPARRLACRQGPSTATTLYETPVGISTVVSSVIVCNTGASAVTIRIFHAISGESFVAANAIVYDLSAAASSTTTIEIPIYLSPGDRIGFYASTASTVTFTMYGREAPSS